MNLNITMLGQIISFIFFVWFCMKFIWPPIIHAIEKRQEEVANSLLYVKNAKNALKLDKEKLQIEVQNAQDKALDIIQKANIIKVKIVEQAKICAKKEAKRIFEKNALAIELERVSVREELIQEVGALAIKIAKKIINRQVSEDKNNDILQHYISKL